MRRSIAFLPVALVAVTLTAAACDDNNTPPTPTTPTNPTIVTETFTGTVNPNGAVTHSFNTESSGTLSATLVSVNPASRIGLSLGTWNGISCKIEIANDNAQMGVTVTGTASALGSFCARIYDVGALTGNVTYEVRVTHP